MSKFKVSQLAFAVCLVVIVTSGSVASWSIPGGADPETDFTTSQPFTPNSESVISDSGTEAPASDGQSAFLSSFVTSTPESRLANLLLDPNAAGSDEVVYPDPSEPEQPIAGNLAAPKNFRVTDLGDDFVSLSFTASPSVSLYQAYIRHGDSYTATGVGQSGTVTFRNLTADYDYVACVYYMTAEAESNRACLDIHTTGTRPVEPVKAPAPANVQLSATQTTVTASFDEVPGASWYYVCHVSGDMSWQCGGYTHLTPTKVIFQDGSISPATRYGITVEAVMSDGSWSERAIRYITTPGTPPPPPTKYAAPTNLRITAISTTSVTASWDYPADSPISVWSFTTRRLTSYSATGVDGAGRSFTYNGLAPSTGYEIILSGRDENGKQTEEVRLGFYTPAN